MTKNNTVEKIDQIIKKIGNTSKKELSDKEARKLLRGIDEDLAEIEKNVEGKQKEIVSSKVEEFRKEINKNLSKWGWGAIETFLIDDVRDDLEELKNKIVESEEISVSIPTIVVDREKEEKLEKELAEVKGELSRTKEELTKTKEEFEKLRSSPPKSTGVNNDVIDVYAEKISKLNEQVKAKENEIQELKRQLEAKDREVFELANKSIEKKSFGESVAREAHNYLKDGAETGAEIGSKVFPIIGPAVGGFAGVGVAGVGALLHVGVDGADRFAEHGKEVLGVGVDFAKKTGTDVKEVTEKGMELTGKGIEVGGHVFEKYLEEGAGVYKTTLESGTEIAINAGSGAVSIIKEGMKSGDEARKELKEFAENMTKFGMTAADGAVGHGKDIGAFIIDRSIAVADGAADKGLTVLGGTKEFAENFLTGAKDLLEGWTGTRSEKEKIEFLMEKLEEKEKRINGLMESHNSYKEEKSKEIRELKEEKNEEIKELKRDKAELKERIKELEKKLGESQERLVAQIEVNRAPSPTPPYGTQ